jgi:hypothetical protein
MAWYLSILVVEINKKEMGYNTRDVFRNQLIDLVIGLKSCLLLKYNRQYAVRLIWKIMQDSSVLNITWCASN